MFLKAILLLQLVLGQSELKAIDRELAGCNGIDIREMTIPQAQAYFRVGQLTPIQLTRCYLERIRRMNPYLNAVIETNPEAEAIALTTTDQHLPLYGIPILLKDNIDTLDRMNTTAGNKALIGVRPKKEADVVRRLREAGAVILGKANLSEMAGFFSKSEPMGFSGRGGQTRNPFVKGGKMFGSSSGSAVAVSANLAMAAIGTETDGSLMGPSSISSVVSLKPSFESISNEGVIPIALSMDTVGAITRTANDNFLVSKIITKASLELPNSIEGRRVGIIRTPFFEGAESQASQIENTLGRLTSKGTVLVDQLTIDIKDINFMTEINAAAVQFRASIHDYLTTQVEFSEGYERVRSLEDLIRFAKAYDPPRQVEFLDYAASLKDDETHLANGIALKAHVQTLITDLLDLHHLDALAIPTLPSTRGIGLSAVAGYPIVNIPSGYDDSGVPFGLAIFSRPSKESLLLKLAIEIEENGEPIRHSPSFIGYKNYLYLK